MFRFIPTPSNEGIMFTNTITGGTVTFTHEWLTRLDAIESYLMQCITLDGDIRVYA